MEIDLTTPSLLFPAISLLLLAYTNRFLGLATVVRSLHSSFKTSADPVYIGQIHNLRKRIKLIRNMQILGVLSIFFCTGSMFCLFMGWLIAGQLIFAGSLVLMLLSLAVSLWEIAISVGALNLQLQDIEAHQKQS
ncbi:DUF2721 domain-containing protein [Phragmitibacter flavus]|uniref:DUF2721 domain-containing protein n=1 Tax=Phragmitibacter flavus TaxID=2576071 RepID=A0A5R8KI00_9BACT|nr:DUF2721 domain-containing protein [Phragmitibacter flavus]TLD71861.1 DUF2721 domain-containing protein [Phragmitibacter flavus]